MGISLDQINEEVETRFAPFVVDDVPGGEVVMRNPIRMSKADRVKVTELNKALTAARKDVDEKALVDITQTLVKLVCAGDGGTRLCKELGRDVAKLVIVLDMYMAAMHPGEASPSEG